MYSVLKNIKFEPFPPLFYLQKVVDARSLLKKVDCTVISLDIFLRNIMKNSNGENECLFLYAQFRLKLQV